MYLQIFVRYTTLTHFRDKAQHRYIEERKQIRKRDKLKKRKEFEVM